MIRVPPLRWWLLLGAVGLSSCDAGEVTGPGDPPGGAKPTLPGVPSILSPVAGKFRVTGVENRDCIGLSGFWTFCQHQADLHAEARGIQASDDTYAWDLNRMGPSGELNTDLGQTVFAVEPGRVVPFGGSVAPGTDECKSLLIEHVTNGTTWWSGYLHMSEVLVADGQQVTSTTPVGKVGQSCATNDHLHFVAYTGSNTSRGLLSRDVGFVERIVTLPSVPSDLAASPISSSQVNLAWTGLSANTEGVRVERCAGASCSDFAELAALAPGTTSYQNTGLTGSTTYRYRVRAHNTVGNSGYSNTASATTPVLVVAPVAPSTLGATAPSPTQVNLSWTDNSANEDGFRIERCTGAACSDFAELTTTAANAVSYQNTGLTASTTYRYRVRAFNAAGTSAYSNVLTIATPLAVPAAPTSLAAAAASSSQINLTWTDNATTEEGFRIERCAGVTCTNFVEVATAAANATSYQNTGLAASTAYQYRVRAFNTAGTSSLSNVASATTQVGLTAPLAPTVLTATTQSTSQIDLAWTDNATNEDNYKVERCTGAGCSDFAEIASLAANAVSYQSTGLTGSTTYTYRVRATNAAGNSAYSTSAAATTQTVLTAPAAPTSLAATAQSPSQIDLAWTDNATNEDGYKVERCTGAACSDFAEIVTLAANATSYQNTGLAEFTTYRYRVRAVNGAGASSYTTAASAQTPQSLPAAPSSLSATEQSASQINLGWTDNATNEDGYKVERCAGASCTNFAEIASLPANTISYQNTGLSESTTYRYRVRAANSAGHSSYSSIAAATTPVALPAAPSNLTAVEQSFSAISLAWTDNAGNESGYKVERCVGASCTDFAEIASLAANTTGYQNTGLTGSTTYRYRVRASNSAGNSSYSAIAAATTLLAPPAAPTNLTAVEQASAQVNLSWTDNATNESSYKVERCTGLGCTDFSEIASLAANATDYQDTGLTQVTTYRYRVRATNSAGSSNYSNATSATTLSASPTVVTIASPGVSEVAFTMSGSVNPNGVTTAGFFEWSSDPALGSLTATTPVNVGSGTAPLFIGSIVPANSCGLTFHYRAVGVNALAVESRGAIQPVTLSACTIPALPTAGGPGTTDAPGPTLSSSGVSLTWTGVTNAWNYNVVVVDVQSGTEVVNVMATANTPGIQLVAGKEYRWSLAACNPAGCSAFTAPLYFKTP